MDLLIFGNSAFPDISFSVNPKEGFQISCKNNVVLAFEGLWNDVNWKQLMEYTSPRITGPINKGLEPLGGVSMKFLEKYWSKFWAGMKGNLTEMCQSKAERAFVDAYFAASEQTLFTKQPRQLSQIAELPALIPQAWINWIHFDPKDKDRADRLRQEPFRVDFVILYENRKLVIEIDGISHFTDILEIDAEKGVVHFEASLTKYTEHIKKDRWLRQRGWEVWRFTDQEVLDEDFGIQSMLLEMDIGKMWRASPYF